MIVHVQCDAKLSSQEEKVKIKRGALLAKIASRKSLDHFPVRGTMYQTGCPITALELVIVY